MFTTTTIGVLCAYVIGSALGAVMMYRQCRKTEVQVIEYTIEMMIENKFIKTRTNDKSEIILVAYDSEGEND